MSMSEPQAPVSERETLARQLANMVSPYAQALRPVNQHLLESGVPLSAAARQGIVHNATLAETGQISPESASFGEVPILAREAVACFRRRELAHTGLFMMGTLLNATAAPLVGIPAMRFGQMPLLDRIAEMDGDALFPGAGAGITHD